MELLPCIYRWVNFNLLARHIHIIGQTCSAKFITVHADCLAQKASTLGQKNIFSYHCPPGHTLIIRELQGAVEKSNSNIHLQ